jgi:hypothetical protein
MGVADRHRQAATKSFYRQDMKVALSEADRDGLCLLLADRLARASQSTIQNLQFARSAPPHRSWFAAASGVA